MINLNYMGWKPQPHADVIKCKTRGCDQLIYDHFKYCRSCYAKRPKKKRHTTGVYLKTKTKKAIERWAERRKQNGLV